MDKSALAASLVFWFLTGLLPRIFFRKDGNFNLKWWLTALPTIAAPALVLAAAFGGIHAETPKSWETAQGIVSTIVTSFAVGMLFFTLGTHRVPIALWHQDNDAPRSIVTYGAYSRVRHPFYVSFLLAMVGVAVLIPHWSTLLTLVYALLRLNATAAREEARLSESEFGSEYREYIRRTGRFVPRLVGAR
jgi:protein-S-isoprenylcysteine O-methyltransferase Ste14